MSEKSSIFAGMNQFKENVILADADYVDRVTFDLTVNFERMIGRRIPKADLAQWLECVALDGGLKPQGQAVVQVILLHKKGQMDNFVPAAFAERTPRGAFSTTMVSSGFVPAFSMPLRYGSGCGLPCSTS